MNTSEKDIELTPGKLYILSGHPRSAFQYDGVQYTCPMTLRAGSIMFYISVIETDFIGIPYLCEFLYMDRLIYLNINVAKTSSLTELV